MDEGPAHLGLIPAALRFVPADASTADAISSVFSITSAERADHGASPPLGYYRLTNELGAVHFAKVVSGARAQVVRRANRLGSAVNASGVPVPECHFGPLGLPGGQQLFIYEWTDGRFFEPSVRDLSALGSVIAHLHEILPQCAIPDTRVTWAEEDKGAIVRLAEHHFAGPAEAAAAQMVIRRWEWGCERLHMNAQPVHNDLHPGNILFDRSGKVCAVLDFEEALNAWYSPLVDLSWIIERWCLLRSPAGIAFEGAVAFLEAYCDRIGRTIRLERGVLSYISLWRCVVALSLLASQGRDESAAWHAEWRKFRSIITSLPRLEPPLEALEDRFP